MPELNGFANAGDLSTDPNSGINQGTDTTTKVADQNGGEQKQAAPKSEDKDAGYRYHISQQKDTIKKLNEQIEMLKKGNGEKPLFNDETDPDGTKQIEYIAEQKAQKMVQEQLSKLGLDDKLAELQRSEFENQFFQNVEKYREEFTSLGLDNFDKDNIKSVIDQVYSEEKGLTPRQALFLANMDKVLATRQAPKDAPSPDLSGEKPEGTQQLSQEQIFNNIFTKHGI